MNDISRVDYHRWALATRQLDAQARALVNEASARRRVVRALCGGFRADADAALAEHFDDASALLDAAPASWWFDAPRLQVVVTGFGPFLAHARNPSWEVAQAASARIDEAVSCRCERIEVTYEAAEAFGERVGWHDGQRLVIHCGLAARAQQLGVERFAHNCRGPLADGTSARGWPDWVVPDGPVAVETLLDVAGLVDGYAQHANAEPSLPGARVSRDPGDYVCNAMYYHSLRAVRAARQAERAAEALFVHLPAMDAHTAHRVGDTLGLGVLSYLGARLDLP